MEESYLHDDRTVSDSHAEALGIVSSDNEGRVTYDGLMNAILDDGNIDTALKQVVSNRGAPGVDGMTVQELRDGLPAMRGSLEDSIRTGRYRPSPVRRVEIPKPDGGARDLGVPTAKDRIVQQMIAQILVPIFDPMFSESSFGFRPGRSAHDAIQRVKELYDDGYVVAVSIDLSKYFDTIPQDNLMREIRKTVRDMSVTDLVKRFLKSGVAMPDGLTHPTEEGSPQGGPLSPLLSNIYLDRFDRELERRGLHFVRYADDCTIYVRTQRAAERVMESCTGYLEDVLRLKVNRQKSAIGSPMELKYLGFRLMKLKDGTVWIAPHERSVKRFKAKIRSMTKRHRGTSVKVIVDELRRYMRGWFAYFAIGPNLTFFDELDGWVRRRVRAILLVQWKTPKNRQKQLNRIGHLNRKGRRWDFVKGISYKKHVWASSMTPTINSVLNNENLREETGMYYMTDDWTKVQARFPRSPLRSRTVGSVGGRQSTLFEFLNVL